MLYSGAHLREGEGMLPMYYMQNFNVIKDTSFFPFFWKRKSAKPSKIIYLLAGLGPYNFSD